MDCNAALNLSMTTRLNAFAMNRKQMALTAVHKIKTKHLTFRLFMCAGLLAINSCTIYWGKWCKQNNRCLFSDEFFDFSSFFSNYLLSELILKDSIRLNVFECNLIFNYYLYGRSMIKTDFFSNERFTEQTSFRLLIWNAV